MSIVSDKRGVSGQIPKKLVRPDKIDGTCKLKKIWRDPLNKQNYLSTSPLCFCHYDSHKVSRLENYIIKARGWSKDMAGDHITYSRILISQTLDFSNLPISQTKKHLPWKNFSIILLPISRNGFHFPRGYEKSGFPCSLYRKDAVDKYLY